MKSELISVTDEMISVCMQTTNVVLTCASPVPDLNEETPGYFSRPIPQPHN
jgi:hypothetical protein